MESNCRKLVSACVQLGVQPSTVECLFSKDPDLKKGDFGEAPEGRKEASSSKLFGRPHPSANGNGFLLEKALRATEIERGASIAQRLADLRRRFSSETT